MTPPCPSCGAPLCNGTQFWVCDTCAYGHDAPRSLIPQPDVAGVAQEFATREGICGTPHGPGGWKDCAKCCAWIFSQPAPTPQRTGAGEVADPLAPLPEDSYECRCVICYGGFLGHKHITVCPRCVRKNAEDAALIMPAASPAVDEGMRLSKEARETILSILQEAANSWHGPCADDGERAEAKEQRRKISAARAEIEALS